jgi:hypothetical protein
VIPDDGRLGPYTMVVAWNITFSTRIVMTPITFGITGIVDSIDTPGAAISTLSFACEKYALSLFSSTAATEMTESYADG